MMLNNAQALEGSYLEYRPLTKACQSRIKRSGLKMDKGQKFGMPVVSLARKKRDLEQNFSLVYEIYREKGYISRPRPHKMFFSIYSLLPETTHISVRRNLATISNLTHVPDTKEFGLPMDSIYKRELDLIRSKGRKIAELSALATPCRFRWRNIFLYQIQAVYWYALYRGIDDICIVVNPRHKKFYTSLFPFEELGPVRHYPRVNAPAVGLRGRVYEALDYMMKISDLICSDAPFYKWLYRVEQSLQKSLRGKTPARDHQLVFQPVRLDSGSVHHFLSLEPSILSGLNRVQKKMLENAYPGLSLC
ncbi:N-acyl amino acid synthase FeeM domain-containing protein [Desulfonatronovibrio hydrogenovorans]|uniref:N-acyl amino acid synthase FeeM domain-containing protein n=1 Tax=Desulfonatronovibrio hydrogenovorans TaxID=53245 RepID=UPI00068CC125|nr:hypothetical protein [Desulfonatronovibrio hydrogenovorans]